MFKRYWSLAIYTCAFVSTVTDGRGSCMMSPVMMNDSFHQFLVAERISPPPITALRVRARPGGGQGPRREESASCATRSPRARAVRTNVRR